MLSSQKNSASIRVVEIELHKRSTVYPVAQI
jgi:hypothetical protein